MREWDIWIYRHWKKGGSNRGFQDVQRIYQDGHKWTIYKGFKR